MTVLTPGSTLVTSIADAITTVLASLQANGVSLTAYDHEPGAEGMSLPAGTVTLLSLDRPLLHEGESAMGTDDWDTTWRVRLYIDLDDARLMERTLETLAADAVLAFDNDQTLAGLAIEARITKAETGDIDLDRGRPIAVLQCELDCRRLVDTLYH